MSATDELRRALDALRLDVSDPAVAVTMRRLVWAAVDEQVVGREDTAVLVAGIRLYDALYHADLKWLKTLPPNVLDAYGDMQTAVERRTRGGEGRP